MKTCAHRSIVLIGNEETGLRSCHCRSCGEPMTRRRVGGIYIYLTIRLANALMDWRVGETIASAYARAEASYSDSRTE